jgi:hypothetical protein
MGFVDVIQTHDVVFGDIPLWPVYLNHLRYQEWCDLSLHEELWDLVASIFCDLHASKGGLGNYTWGWPAVLRLALHGGKVSFSSALVGFKSEVQICRTEQAEPWPASENGRHPPHGFAPPVLGHLGFASGLCFSASVFFVRP